MVVYLKAGEILDNKFQVLSTDVKTSYVTNYDYWLKNKRHIGGLIVKDEETDKFKIWKDGSFEELEGDFWYKNDEGKKRCYLAEEHSFQCEFETEQVLPVWDKETKGKIDTPVTKFVLKASHSQHKGLYEMINDDAVGTNCYYQFEKDGKAFKPKFKGMIKLNKSEEKVSPSPMKKSDGLNAEELGYIETAKAEGLNKEDFKNWLRENKTNLNINDDKIEKLVSEL